MATGTVERKALLSQIIAVRPTVTTDAEQAKTKMYQMLQRTGLLNGLTRTYTPNNDDGFRYPSETTQVLLKGTQALRQLVADFTRLLDVTATMDWTNQQARADVVITTGEQPFVLLSDVPVTYLMFLEKQLVDWETVIRKLPVLDPTERWTYDPATDVYRSDPVITVKTMKVRSNHVLAAATDRHPAQVESYTEDVPVGTWSTVKFSGALPAESINRMLARIQSVLLAVKFAREQANMIEVVDPKPGRRVFDYVFGAEV